MSAIPPDNRPELTEWRPYLSAHHVVVPAIMGRVRYVVGNEGSGDYVMHADEKGYAIFPSSESMRAVFEVREKMMQQEAEDLADGCAERVERYRLPSVKP